MHRLCLIAVTLMLVLLSAPPASAITPPSIDPGAEPPDVTGPEQLWGSGFDLPAD